MNQTKEIWRDFTRFAIISKPKIQITQNKNPAEANYISYHIVVNYYKTDIQFSQKKNAPLMMHFYWHTLYASLITSPCISHTSLISNLILKKHILDQYDSPYHRCWVRSKYHKVSLSYGVLCLPPHPHLIYNSFIYIFSVFHKITHTVYL